ncbi:MAG: DNA-binding domain-containing protein [Pseudomonadota bacterium]
MHSLRELQLEMERAIVAPQLATVPQALISDHISSRQRLNVYRINFAAGHHEALAAVYPVIKRLVGDEFFEHTAAIYHYHDLRLSANVHDYGRVFAAFLKDFAPVKNLPYLPDIARLEWSYHEVFHTATDVDLNINLDAPAIADDDILVPHPTLRWMESAYPVLEIWRQNHQEQGDPDDIDLMRGGDHLLIYRTDLDVEIVRLNAAEYSLVSALACGTPIGEAFAVCADQVDVAATMAFCLSRRIFTALKKMGAKS